MSLFDKIFPPKIRRDENSKSGVPEGLWSKCPSCSATLYAADLANNCNVCPKCNHHNAMTARERLDLLLDENNREEIAANIKPTDILKFKDSKKYPDRLSAARKTTGEDDALVVMKGEINGLPIVIAAFEFRFIGGSMGSVVGDRFVLAAEKALAERKPLVCFAASGGARMQEGLLSLMQMARTSAAIERLRLAAVPYVVILTNPVYGGVTASLAMLGDVHIAEPKAMIGFAGKRVIEQTVREVLDEPFQRAEFLLEKGTVDMVVHRHQLVDTTHRILAKLSKAAA